MKRREELAPQICHQPPTYLRGSVELLTSCSNLVYLTVSNYFEKILTISTVLPSDFGCEPVASRLRLLSVVNEIRIGISPDEGGV